MATPAQAELELAQAIREWERHHMTHSRDRFLQAFMALMLVGLVVFGICQDDAMAVTFLFGYLGVAAYWVWGRRE